MNESSNPTGKGKNHLRSSPAAAQGIDLSRALNPSQREAVTCNQGHLLVIAGAGSGKTRTLIFRVARLIEEGVSPESILLLSFTRKAAREMLERAAALLDRRCRQVAGGTFHSFAYSMLRRHAQRIGLPNNFSMLDRHDMEDLINMVRKQRLSGDTAGVLPRKSTLATLFSRSANKGLSVEEIVYEDYSHLSSQVGIINKMWEAYQEYKREHLYFDFDDLLIYLRQLLFDSETVRNRLQRRFRHIMVDEYQDTNHIQADIISMMVGPGQQLMVVGDDSQSIYAFRGADFKNIIRFADRFPGTTIVKLEQNYRSLQPILDLTNAIIDQAAQKYAKHLYTRRGGDRIPLLVAAANEHIQSRYVIEEVRRRHSRGIAYKDMAVLFRSGYQSFDLELELTRCNIPFVKYGGFKFSESAHVKDLLAHLKVFVAPRDRLSWYRILRLIPKVGLKTAQHIYDALSLQNEGVEGLLSLTTGIREIEALTPLKELVAAVNPACVSVSALGESVLTYYRPLLEARYDDHPRRLRDLEQLLNIMERYDDLEHFLADMTLEPPDTSIDGRLSDGPDPTDRLILSTVHSAKGLEWHTVFLIWALDGRFPSHHALDRVDNLEEERRLMYVATTRAKDDLIITYPAQVFDRASGSILYQPSRFLEGIDQSLIKKVFLHPGDI